MATALQARTTGFALTQLVLLAIGCTGGQSTDDLLGDEDRKPDLMCVTGREVIAMPEPALMQAIERMLGSYGIAGRFGEASGPVGFTPSDSAMEGTLELEARAGEIARVSMCDHGIEVPVNVTLRTDDGAFDDTVEGIALLDEGYARATVDGSPAPLVARVTASFELAALSGNFEAEDNPRWKLARATLRAEVTSYGTRGELSGTIEPREGDSDDESVQSVAPGMDGYLLAWPTEDACNSDTSEEMPLDFELTEDTQLVLDAIERVSGQSYAARYADGTATTFTAEIEPPTAACGVSYVHLPTIVHVQTGDGRIDVRLPVSLDPGFATLHWNQRTDIGWGMPPATFEERIGHVDVELAEHDLVGIESWFDEKPEPTGWLKVFGWDHGECVLCNADGACVECPSDDRATTALTLLIGAQADDAAAR